MSEEKKPKLLVGMLGWSSQNIEREQEGLCWFPTGPEDSKYSYGYRWQQKRVHAMEDVRAFREVIVVDERERVKEHTPVEAKILGYIYDDYVLQAYTGAEVKYVIGTAARAADATLPADFLADQLWLLATTNCLVRFEISTPGRRRVQHLLTANIQYFYPRRVKEIFIVQQVAPGTLEVRAFGNEVGV